MPDNLAQRIECLLFVSGEPLSAKDLAKTTETDLDCVYTAIRELRDRYVYSGLQVVEIAGGFQLSTRPEYATTVGRLLAPHANRLSRPALETAAIVAYRQPCTQADIEAVRGVASDGVLKTLVERGLIQEAGRKQTPGRPIVYATTEDFLHYFGLADLSELPLMDEDETPNDEEIATALAAAGVTAQHESAAP